MRKQLKLLYYLFVLAIGVACSEKDVIMDPYLEVETEIVDFDAEASARIVSLSTNLSSLEVVSNMSWCRGRYNEGKLIISVESNSGTDIREAVLTINALQYEEKIVIRQLGSNKAILINPRSVDIIARGETKSIEITSNIDYSIKSSDWVKVIPFEQTKGAISTKQYQVVVDINTSPKIRKDTVRIKDIEEEVEVLLLVLQKEMGDYVNKPEDDINDDIKIEIVGGEASSYQADAGIEKSFDGNYNSIYHSNWNNDSPDYFPITLKYKFENKDIDYFIYHPRSSGHNGNFKEVNISVTTSNSPVPVVVKRVDFGGSSLATKINFDEPLKDVTSVIFEVVSGAGDNQGFATCAEMEFYQQNIDNFDPLSLFTDITCSSLKPEVSIEDIRKCPYEFYRNIATYILTDRYEDEFRIADYHAWLNPDIQAAELKTNPYSLLDNPTGIFAEQGEELVVFVSENCPIGVGIKIQNLDLPEGDGYYNNSSTYALSAGVNKIIPRNRGLIYVLYHSNRPEQQEPIKIHFATGAVNGYFDSQKHDASRWQELLGNAKDKFFDVLGRYAHMTFPTERFRTSTPDGKVLVDKFDELVYEEAKFMGLEKYDKMFKNRHYFHAIYTSYMYATSYRTAYNVTTLEELCDVNRFTASPWGPAHEVGHCNQTRPGLKWIGMTEVTNNIHSLYIETLWGNTSRLTREKRYEAAHKYIADNPDIAYCQLSGVFEQLVPFWQLYLYLSKTQGKEDFYKDLYEAVRTTPNPPTNGACQLEFIKKCIQISQLDLTDFFEYWRFFVPIDIEIDDYGKGQLTITQEDINDIKVWIKEQGFEKPAHEFWNINDENIQEYQ